MSICRTVHQNNSKRTHAQQLFLTSISSYAFDILQYRFMESNNSRTLKKKGLDWIEKKQIRQRN